MAWLSLLGHHCSKTTRHVCTRLYDSLRLGVLYSRKLGWDVCLFTAEIFTLISTRSQLPGEPAARCSCNREAPFTNFCAQFIYNDGCWGIQWVWKPQYISTEQTQLSSVLLWTFGNWISWSEIGLRSLVLYRVFIIAYQGNANSLYSISFEWEKTLMDFIEKFDRENIDERHIRPLYHWKLLKRKFWQILLT